MSEKKAQDDSLLHLELKEGIWNGKIPLQLSLARPEALGQLPPPMFILIPRMSYLPVISSKIRSHFLSSVAVHEDCIWFEEGESGLPLKWETPVGVLYDLLGGGVVPWQLTVHFQNFPDNKLMRIKGPAVVMQTFFTTLKQAVFLLHNSAKPVLDLERSRQLQIWEKAVMEGDLSYWMAVHKALSEPKGSINVKPSLPVRIYLSGFGKALDLRPFQRQLRETSWSNMTVGEVIFQILPGLKNIAVETFEVVVQGLPVPLKTGLAWLSTQARNPDLYLYIVVRRIQGRAVVRPEEKLKI